MEKDMDEIFKKFDSRLKLNPKGYVSFAKSKGYRYYSEYVFEEKKTRTCRSISEEMQAAGVKKYPNINTINGLYVRLQNEINAAKSTERICVK